MPWHNDVDICNWISFTTSLVALVDIAWNNVEIRCVSVTLQYSTELEMKRNWFQEQWCVYCAWNWNNGYMFIRLFKLSKGASENIRVSYHTSVSSENNWDRASFKQKYCRCDNNMIIIQNCVWYSTQHLELLPFFLVSKYGEWAVVTFFRLPTTFGIYRRYEAHLSKKVFNELCFYLQPFVLRHRPGLVHCKPPLLSNLNGCMDAWKTLDEIEQMYIVDTV